MASPLYYSNKLIVLSSTNPFTIADWGFNASFVRVVNRAAVPIKVNFQGLDASSADVEIGSSEIFSQAGLPPVRGLGLWTTSTSTGALSISLTAMGW